MSKGRLDFREINAAALAHCPAFLFDLLPDGKVKGTEYLARNPRRKDRCLGSFSVNVQTGKWCDFASGDKGGDLISLAAFVWDLYQGEAARELARMMGVR